MDVLTFLRKYTDRNRVSMLSDGSRETFYLEWDELRDRFNYLEYLCHFHSYVPVAQVYLAFP